MYKADRCLTDINQCLTKTFKNLTDINRYLTDTEN